MFYVASAMITSLRTSLRGLSSRFAGEQGQDLIEYALLSGIIAAAIVGVTAAILTGALNSMATGISHCVDFKSSTPCAP
jgi:Flp pilus assembly pilin Flp